MTSRVSAAFDALAITAALERTAGGAAASELHVFSYLACLMAFYESIEPQDWSYGFSSTAAGAPYAQTLAEECDRLRASGRLLDRGDMLMLSTAGRTEVEGLRRLRSCAARERYLEAACAAASLLPLPSVADALSYEPQLQLALRRETSRALMQPVGLALVDEHFRAIQQALVERAPESRDLLVPTTVWLSYLAGAAGKPEAE